MGPPGSDAGPPTGGDVAVGPRRAGRLRLLGSVLLAAVIFAVLLRRVDTAGILTAVGRMTWLELVTIAAVAAWLLVTYWASRLVVRGRWGDVRVETFRARRVEITSEVPRLVEYDGEVGDVPLARRTVEAAPGAVTVVVPDPAR